MIPADPFLLRPYRATDAAEMAAAIRESAETMGRWVGWFKPGFSEYDAHCWIDMCNNARAYGGTHEFGIFTADGKLLGSVSLNQFQSARRACELGYWVRRSCEGRGAATAAVRALKKLAFESLRLARLELVIADGNEPSCAVARKAGATYEGLARNRLMLHGRLVAAHIFSFTTEG